jgi:hypothetical protein
VKRFSETNKWEDPWFRKLKPKYKTFLQYLFDRCDNAGVWVVDLDLAATYVGDKIDGGDALKVFEGRVVDMQNGKWLIPQFVQFQYGVLSVQCHPHKKILELLTKHSLIVGSDGKTTLPGTLPTRVVNTLQDKEEEKDKDKEVSSGAEKRDDLGLNFPQNLRTPGFTATWEKWVPFRKKMKGCKDWVTLFQGQLDWLGTFPEGTAIAILDQSIRQGWQGLWEIKSGAGPLTKPPTTFDIRTALANKEKEAEAFKRKHFREHQGLSGGQYLPAGWDSEQSKAEHAKLKAEAQALKEKFNQMAA